MSTLEIKDLHVHVETKEGIKPILKGATLTVHSGETHAIMGPNGSGKSTLAYTLAGHPKYVVDSGEALLDGKDILKMTPDERAKAGLFLAMQYPVEIPGVSMTNFLRTAKTEIDGEAPGIRQWAKDLSAAMKRLKMDPKFASRSVNEGFSGGEKKRAEVLQLELLKPKFAVLDETDSGLDVDALRIVSEGVNRAKEANQFGILMVTHYTRILKYIKPDIVHVFADGLVDRGIELVILGSGESQYENFFSELCARHPGRVGTYIGFEPALSQEIYAGADAFIMPSKSEPCGLAQMVACRYGTPPIVRETGGLRDSIHDSTMGDGNGFTFAGYSAHELYEACCHAQDAYNNKENWHNLVHHCMECDFSWDVSAKSYEGLYNETANLW